jgi:hypothetical protein
VGGCHIAVRCASLIKEVVFAANKLINNIIRTLVSVEMEQKFQLKRYC